TSLLAATVAAVALVVHHFLLGVVVGDALHLLAVLVVASDGNLQILEQVKSADLKYDENNKIIDATDENGILTLNAAKQIKINTWQNSNVKEVMKGVDCVVFPGGVDICPTLYYNEEEWHGILDDSEYSTERDVSDYLLLSYCLENDIPMLCICRGMQMLSVVSGADMIQDISTWYTNQGLQYQLLHRDIDKNDFMPHSVTVSSKESLLYQIYGEDIIDKVPSWHHQAVESIDNTRLVVTAYTDTDGYKIIEGVERPDKRFCIGVQFHPEVAARKILDKEQDAEKYMEYDKAIILFKALLERK
ncbi:MAG: gamma-glutamyl-gamma-aminobutyrate hydrolase family protein, partial [Lachnospiraceae bacterium]|nr:gamma-glutamyl-gamma-aminobutyrate hydrolase family protein [Lachnospiraceae bacterium]